MGYYFFVIFVGLVAGVVGGVIGTGSSIILLPILVLSFGPKEAVPIMGIAAVMANVGRVAAWWREIEWRAFLAYSISAVPAAAAGAQTLIVLPARLIDLGLGLFFLFMVPFRRWLRSSNLHASRWHLVAAGAVIGFLTGLVVSVGPLSVATFASRGLLKGALLSTEAATSLAVYTSKVITFQTLGALPLPTIYKGLLVGLTLIIGAFVGKALVIRMKAQTFEMLLDGVMVCSGLTLLWASLG